MLSVNACSRKLRVLIALVKTRLKMLSVKRKNETNLVSSHWHFNILFVNQLLLKKTEVALFQQFNLEELSILSEI